MKGGQKIGTGLVPTNYGVMVVDEDPTSRLLISTMLKTCNYRVESFENARDALLALWEKKGEFDLVMTEIHMLSMDGFLFLQRVVAQFDVPVITMCSDNDPKLHSQALMNGAYFHLLKPIDLKKMEVVWQKAWKKKAKSPVAMTRSIRNPLVVGIPDVGSSSKAQRIEPIEGETSKGKKKAEDVEELEHDADRARKRRRLQWDSELHRRFLVAVRLLGDDAVPIKIIDLMNVEGLTNKQISSHLQKHRKRLEKMKQLGEKQHNSSVSKFTTTLEPKVPPNNGKKLKANTKAPKHSSVDHNKNMQVEFGANDQLGMGNLQNSSFIGTDHYDLPNLPSSFEKNQDGNLANVYSTEGTSWEVNPYQPLLTTGSEMPQDVDASLFESSVPVIGASSVQCSNMVSTTDNNLKQGSASGCSADDWAALERFLGLTEETATAAKDNAADAVAADDPAALEKFLGPSEQPATTGKENATEGPSMDFKLDSDFDLQDFDFDNFVADFLNDDDDDY